LNRVIDKERKIYGLTLIGIVFGVISAILGWIIVGMTASIVATLAGYVLGNFISGLVHKGYLQRWIYWNTPMGRKILGSRYMVSSHQRRFM
jgi:hypothetical protein